MSRTEAARRISLPAALLTVVLIVVFLVGFVAGTALADLHLPSSPIGQPPVIKTQVVRQIIPNELKRAEVTVRIVPTPTPFASGRCGGDLPPCWVMARESTGPGYPNGGDPNAYNPTGCGGRGCRGKWQCDPRTCDGTGTEAEQDAEARRVWANGAGCSHWAAC